MITTSILDDEVRVQAPFVKVTIGDIPFGVYQDETGNTNYDNLCIQQGIKYPNYIQTLEINKINGEVNEYTLNLCYGRTQYKDASFLDKVLSSVREKRKIIFSYGDCNAPAFTYRDEEAIITDYQRQQGSKNGQINYVIYAVSSSQLASGGSFNFSGYSSAKPSDIIKTILQDPTYGLQDIFTGMRNMSLVLSEGLIASDDKAVKINAKTNISTLEYISYLVECMIPIDESSNGVYTFKVYDDTSNIFGGTYFRVISTDGQARSLDTYELTIGYDDELNTAITDFTIDNNEGYAILYDFTFAHSSTQYTERVDDYGNIIQVYSDAGNSFNDERITNADDETWLKNVTQYPITVNITIRGLLRPAILMSKLELDVRSFGQQMMESGTYVISKEVDSIGVSSGFYTKLTAVRIAGI